MPVKDRGQALIGNTGPEVIVLAKTPRALSNQRYQRFHARLDSARKGDPGSAPPSEWTQLLSELADIKRSLRLLCR